MRRLPGVLIALTVGALATDSVAQEKPDFSGRWTSGPPPGASGFRGGPPGSMGSGWGAEINITQDIDWLTVESLIFTRGDLQPPLKYPYALDGSQSRNKIMMGHGIQEFVSGASWDGDKLVITTVHPFPHPDTGRAMEAEVTRILSLQAPAGTYPLTRPPSLVVEMRIEGVLGGPPTTTRTVYTRS